MTQQNESPLENEQPKRKKKVFKNFAEYWHFAKNMTKEQRDLIMNNLSKADQRSLRLSYEKGGWEDLFMRNDCDKKLDEIKEVTKIDFLEVKAKVLSGKPQLVSKSFWNYINSHFDKFLWQHVAFILDGIKIEEYSEDYLKLSKKKSK